MSWQLALRFNRLSSGLLSQSLLLALLCALSAVPVLAQNDCPPPGTRFSYDVSARITDEAGKPLEGVAIYAGSTSPAGTTNADGRWSATISGCTLSPPRCGTGFNNRFAPVAVGYSFAPLFGEICPGTTVSFIARPAPVATVSAASYQNALGPAVIAAAFADTGSPLAAGTAIAQGVPLPEELAGTTTTINSVAVFGSGVLAKKAQIYYVSPGQANFYLPPDLGEGPAEIVIQTAAGQTLRSSTLITKVAPAFFAANSDGRGVAAAVILRIHEDGSRQYEPVSQFDAATNRFVPLPIDLEPTTDQIVLALFGTGFRFRSSLSNVTATVGGETTEVLYAGEQGTLIGVDQANLLLPHSLLGRGEVDVVFIVDGVVANIVKIAVK